MRERLAHHRVRDGQHEELEVAERGEGEGLRAEAAEARPALAAPGVAGHAPAGGPEAGDEGGGEAAGAEDEGGGHAGSVARPRRVDGVSRRPPRDRERCGLGHRKA